MRSLKVAEMDALRGAVIQGLMNALVVVKAKVVGQSMPRLCNIPVVLGIHLLVFHRAPQLLSGPCYSNFHFEVLTPSSLNRKE